MQHTILGFEVLDHLRLLALQPAGEDDDQRLEEMPGSGHNRGMLYLLVSAVNGCSSCPEGRLSFRTARVCGARLLDFAR